MASIQEEILEEFYQKLAQVDGYTEAKLKKLRDLFSGGKKPKAPEVVKVLSENVKDEVS